MRKEQEQEKEQDKTRKEQEEEQDKVGHSMRRLLGHLLLRLLVCSYREIICLLCSARVARALRGAELLTRSLTRSLTHSLLSSWDTGILLSSIQGVLNPLLLLPLPLFPLPKSVTVGVTDGAMNDKKTLSELIEPTCFRVGVVRDFLQEIKPFVDPVVVPIQDPFGPSTVDPRLQAIVVSQVWIGEIYLMFDVT